MLAWRSTRNRCLAHLIRVQVTRTPLTYIRPSRLPFARTFTMDSVTQALSALSLKPSTVDHAATDSPAAWKAALATTSAPESYQLLKTLVYKPKTAKTAVPIPVVVIAPETSNPNSGAIGKKLNLKELRLASEDLLKEFFSLDKDSRACWQLFLPLFSDRYQYPRSR